MTLHCPNSITNWAKQTHAPRGPGPSELPKATGSQCVWFVVNSLFIVGCVSWLKKQSTNQNFVDGITNGYDFFAALLVSYLKTPMKNSITEMAASINEVNTLFFSCQSFES